jgi:thioredoxin
VATVEVTAVNFEEVVTSNDVVLIDFWAAWCGPCRAFAPIFEKVSAQYPDAVFAKVDTEAAQDLAAAFNIMSIPTLMIIREQVVVYSQAGALPEPALANVIEQVMALDMETVRQQVMAHQGAQS